MPKIKISLSAKWIWKENRDSPQYTSLRKGGKVKIGQKANGKKVKSHHAILFMGKPNHQSCWNDLEHTRNALVKHGFSDKDMIILAGDGKKKWNQHPMPKYVDGKGTKQALFNAIEKIGKKMNKKEQFILWVGDHGNRDRTEVYLNKSIKVPSRQKVPSSKENFNNFTWKIDKKFETNKKSGGTDAWVSLFVDTEFNTQAFKDKSFKLYFNKREMSIRKKIP